MADLRKWIADDASCHHVSRNVLAGGLQYCSHCGAVGLPKEAAFYTQADLDAAVAAALREAAELVQTMQDRRQIVWAKDILALIPDAGAALDRALAAERERCAKVAERPMLPCDLGGDLILDPYTAETIAAAIRAQKENLNG